MPVPAVTHPIREVTAGTGSEPPYVDRWNSPRKGGSQSRLKYDITTLLPPFQGEEVRFAPELHVELPVLPCDQIRRVGG